MSKEIKEEKSVPNENTHIVEGNEASEVRRARETQ